MMRFEKLAIYRDARELCQLAHRAAEELPDRHADIAGMLQQHSTISAFKIARGSAAISRADAYRTFRICKRSAELCHSIIERLMLAQLGDPDVLADALQASSDVQIRAQIIIERIEQKLSPREVFRD